ncbi:MAG: hypothetical protein R3C05_31200 [Pirellulaceae bacterium]
MPANAELAKPSKKRKARWFKISDDRFPGGLVSAILHGGLLLILALWTIIEEPRNRMVIEGRFASEAPVEITLPQPQERQEATVDEPDMPSADSPQIQWSRVELPSLETSPSKLVDPVQTSIDAMLAEVPLEVSKSLARMPSNADIQGREEGKRQELAEKYGANAASEQAVASALEWIVAHQRNDGSWDFDLTKDPCNGRCGNPRHNPSDMATPKTAATGLALLPLLGSGHSHLNGRYRENVSRGIYYLRSQMRDAQSGRELMHGSMYGHGIATLAIAEAFAMTKDEELRDMLRDLHDFIVMAQHPKGGWRYKPGQPGDMTVTGWQVLALKSSQIGGIPMPSLVHVRAEEFVQSLSSEHGTRFGYLGPGAEPTPTAVGLLLQMYLGAPPRNSRIILGCDYLYDLGPSKTDVYFNYYATMTLHHARYYGFPEWNAKLRDYLVATQATKGHEAGSWHFRDHFGDVGGRLYSTAMCALVLETYYRYLPLWEEAEFPL